MNVNDVWAETVNEARWQNLHESSQGNKIGVVRLDRFLQSSSPACPVGKFSALDDECGYSI